MDAIITAAIIAAAAAITGATGVAVSNNRNTKRANQANLDLAKQQNEWNVQQTDKANAYNSPNAQLQRIKDAGLNPNIFYDNGSNAVSSSIAPQSADMARQLSPRIDNPDMSAVTDVAQKIVDKKKLQIESKKADIQQQSVDNEIVKTNANLNFLDAQIQLMAKQGLVAEATVDNLIAQNKAIAASTEQTYHNIQLLDAETAGKLIDNMWKDKQYSTSIAEAESRMQLNSSQISYNRQSIQNLIAQEDQTRATIKLTNGQLELVKTQNGIVSIDLESMRRYLNMHKGRERDIADMQVWLNHVSSGAETIIRGEVDRRNAAVNEQNAETNKRNAATNERNAETNKTNAAANIFRALRGGY